MPQVAGCSAGWGLLGGGVVAALVVGYMAPGWCGCGGVYRAHTCSNACPNPVGPAERSRIVDAVTCRARALSTSALGVQH
eukprot:5144831-Alexandrium_andersonii.AAC.1